MKKAILILSTLLVAFVFYYNYKSEQLLSKAQTHERIKDYERALDYYEDYSEFTNNNVVFAEKLYDIAKIQIEIKDYENAEKNLNHFKRIELSGGWLNSEVDSNLNRSVNYMKSDMHKNLTKIYLATNREQLALELLLTNKESYFTGGCIFDIIEKRKFFVCKVFETSYEISEYENALELVIKYRMYASDVSSKKMRRVIEWKMNQYSDSQKDSIIQSAYDSIKFETSARDSNSSFTMSYNIFGLTVPGKYMPKRLIELNPNIKATDTSKILDLARKEFESSWLYEVMVEAANQPPH